MVGGRTSTDGIPGEEILDVGRLGAPWLRRLRRYRGYIYSWRSFGSRRSRTQSPRIFNESTVTRMAMPGRIETHHACSMSPRPSATITPHDGVGGGVPAPRRDNAA